MKKLERTTHGFWEWWGARSNGVRTMLVALGLFLLAIVIAGVVTLMSM